MTRNCIYPPNIWTTGLRNETAEPAMKRTGLDALSLSLVNSNSFLWIWNSVRRFITVAYKVPKLSALWSQITWEWGRFDEKVWDCEGRSDISESLTSTQCCTLHKTWSHREISHNSLLDSNLFRRPIKHNFLCARESRNFYCDITEYQ